MSYTNQKPTTISLFMGQTPQVFKSLPKLPDISLPFCRNASLQQMLNLKTPIVLIILKLLMLSIVIGTPFLLQAIYTNLNKPDNLLPLVLYITIVSFLRIIIESYQGKITTEMQQNFKLKLSRMLYINQLQHHTRNDHNYLWVAMNDDVDSAINYHNSFLSTYYQIVKMIFAGCYLYTKMKSAVFIGLIVGILLAKLNFRVSQRIGSLFDQLIKIKEKKINIVTFLTSRIQQLKMCRLQNYLFQKIINIRQIQLNNLTKNKLLDSFCVFNWQITSILISSLSLIIYALFLRQNFKNQQNFNVITIITIFQMLIMPLNNLPWSLGGMRNGKVSRDRILKQLQSQENIKHKIKSQGHEKGEVERKKQVSVSIRQGTIDAVEQHQLHIQQMNLVSGQVYSVKGQSGSGKSLFMKSLVGLINSNYSCEIVGNIGYVQPTSFHLPNALCSLYDTLDITETQITQQLKQLLISFHCLQIPLKNSSDTFSGGQKLRLGLVRATLNRDIIVIDSSLQSLDKKVKQHVQSQLRKIAKLQRKIFIIQAQQPLGQYMIQVKDKNVKLVKYQYKQIQQPKAQQIIKQQYCQQFLGSGTSVSDLFNIKIKQQKLGPGYVDKSTFSFYYHSKLHILFIISMIAMYSLKNYYNFYVTSNLNTMSTSQFIIKLVVLVLVYIGAVAARSLFFAIANLKEAKRVVQIFLKIICFSNIDFYSSYGTQELSVVYTSGCQKVGSSYPFYSNILANNIFEFLSAICIILITMPQALIPAILLLMYFWKMQKYFRINAHALEDLSRDSTYQILEIVQNTTKGKTIIRAHHDEYKFINWYDKCMSKLVTIKTATSLLDRWITQRFQLLNLWLLLFILFLVYSYFDKIGWNQTQLSIGISYCIELADKLGWLVKSMAQTQREARAIQSICLINKASGQLNQNRMSEQTKKLIQNNQIDKKLQIRNLSFTYPKQQLPILRNLNLTLSQSKNILIRGKTGAGKTTLFKLLMGLYPKDFKPSYISFSPQKPLILIDSTLQQNLDPYKLFRPQELQPYIEKFSKKNINELPSSEKLKINMFRAELYGKNGVIVYDEPGQDIFEKGTCLIVSHHRDYIVDEKYELKDGILIPLK